MRKYIYILFILIVNCNKEKQSEVSEISIQEEIRYISLNNIRNENPQSFYFITKCDTIPSELIKILRGRNSFQTFQAQTYVYCSPSFESQIIDSIPFNTELRNWKSITRSFEPKKVDQNGKIITINKKRENWLLITHNYKTGYVSAYSMALKKLGSKLLFGERHNEYGYKIFSIGEENRIIDSLSLKRNNGYNIELINFNGLDFCNGVIKYQEFRQSCPGGGSTTLISINKNGEFKEIISYSFDTMGNSEIYFPLKFESGNKLLVQGGNTNQIFNSYNGKINTFEYPRDLNIPIEQLIVETEVKFAEDIEGLTAEEIKIISSDTIYYQWNGTELNKIKTTANNSYK